MTDMMQTIQQKLKKLEVFEGVVIKPYYRPESMSDSDPSVVIVPMAPAKQETFGSNTPLRKQFSYQINVEASTKARATELAHATEKVLLEMGFLQLSGGLDEYFIETRRYVDARRYRGHSALYDVEH